MNIPFNTIEDKYFGLFARSLRPEFHIASRKQLKDGVTRQAEKALATIVREIPQNQMVSVSTDGWTTAFMNHSLCGVFVNYIDAEWRFHSRLIDAVDASDSKTAEARTMKIAKILHNRGLQDRFHFVVADNGSDFNPSALSRNVGSLLGTTVFPQYRHIPCIAHVLQLCV